MAYGLNACSTDFYRLKDGYRLFGESKTLRALLAAVVVVTTLGVEFGFSLGFLCMIIGDGHVW